MEELEQYFDLYGKDDTTIYEKRVLGCYLMEGLNDYVSVHNVKHPLQNRILEVIHVDMEIHQSELDYRILTDDPDEAHCWPIRKYVIEWRLNASHGT